MGDGVVGGGPRLVGGGGVGGRVGSVVGGAAVVATVGGVPRTQAHLHWWESTWLYQLPGQPRAPAL